MPPWSSRAHARDWLGVGTYEVHDQGSTYGRRRGGGRAGTACRRALPGTRAGRERSVRGALRSRPRAAGERPPTGRSQGQSSTVMGDLLSIEADGALDWAGALTGTLTITYTGGQRPTPMRRARHHLDGGPLSARRLLRARWATRSPDSPAASTGSGTSTTTWRDLLGGGSRDLSAGPAAQHHAQPVGEAPAGLRRRRARSATETCAGERTTHYSGTVEVADVADAELQGSSWKRPGSTTETVDIWVNDQNLLVKKVEKGRDGERRMTLRRTTATTA